MTDSQSADERQRGERRTNTTNIVRSAIVEFQPIFLSERERDREKDKNARRSNEVSLCAGETVFPRLPLSI